MKGRSSPGRDADPIIPRVDLAPRVALAITTVVIGGFFTVAVTYVLAAHPSPAMFGGCLAAMGALLVLQLLHSFPRLLPRLAPYRRWTFTAQILLTYLPFTVFGQSWLGMPGFLASSALLLLDGAFAWVAFALVVASIAVVQLAVGYGTASLAYDTVATLLTGLVVYGLSRLSELVNEVYEARGALARMAVMQERLRFARDLHDLLGYSLSAVTLKCELTYRLIPHQPTRAQQEVTEILTIARQALADVRAVASGYRAMSLTTEVASVRSMLTPVGIDTTVRVTCRPLPEPVDTALATVLHEGITNMLRHSNARHCAIEAVEEHGSVRLSIVNDGVSDTGAPRLTGGSGIRNLVERVGAVGGNLRADVHGDRFHLIAQVPLERDEEHSPPGTRNAGTTRPRRIGAGGPTPAHGTPHRAAGPGQIQPAC